LTSTDGAQAWLTAAECARRTGLTVRALRVYERRGLIKPRRTDNAWRLYGAEEISRLHTVIALKRLGLSLTRIVDLCGRGSISLEEALAVQAAGLQDLKDRTERTLGAVAAAQARLARDGALSIDDLTKLIRETDMEHTAASLVAQRRWEQARPRTEVALDPALHPRWVGPYRFETGSVLTVSSAEDRLFVQLTGQPRVEIFAEAMDVFFLKAIPAQVSFAIGEQNRADALVLHQGGLELHASRITAEEAAAAADALARRIEAKSPLAGSEAALLRLLAELRAGELDLGGVTESLAVALRDQSPLVQDELETLGELTALTFQQVSPSGWDIYQASFAHGRQQLRIQLAPDGRVSGLVRARPEP
jgi:DNA-binding transcriptional MerR regulator